jgi:hypothetical protein
MYGIALPQTLTPTPKGMYQISDIVNNDKERIVALEQELFVLRSGKPFLRTDNHHNAASTSRPSAINIPAPGPPVVPNQSGPAISTPSPSTSSTATNPSTSILQPPVHPYAAAKENAYLPPMNTTSPLVRKVKNEKAHRTTPKHQSKTRKLRKTYFRVP